MYLKILSIFLFLVYFLIISSILFNNLSSAVIGLPVAASANVYIPCVSSLKHDLMDYAEEEEGGEGGGGGGGGGGGEG